MQISLSNLFCRCKELSVPEVSSAAQVMNRQRVTIARNKIIDTANLMRAAQGKAPIPRRP